jgi:hypothetical protein
MFVRTVRFLLRLLAQLHQPQQLACLISVTAVAVAKVDEQDLTADHPEAVRQSLPVSQEAALEMELNQVDVQQGSLLESHREDQLEVSSL